jgi:hypothetical protein
VGRKGQVARDRQTNKQAVGGEGRAAAQGWRRVLLAAQRPSGHLDRRPRTGARGCPSVEAMREGPSSLLGHGLRQQAANTQPGSQARSAVHRGSCAASMCERRGARAAAAARTQGKGEGGGGRA